MFQGIEGVVMVGNYLSDPTWSKVYFPSRSGLDCAFSAYRVWPWSNCSDVILWQQLHWAEDCCAYLGWDKTLLRSGLN
jgi:hypothetical protein